MTAPLRVYDQAADTGLHLTRPDAPIAGYDDNAVWLAFGLRKPYRITSNRVDYGEFDGMIEAQMFLALLVEGNPELHRLPAPVPEEAA